MPVPRVRPLLALDMYHRNWTAQACLLSASNENMPSPLNPLVMDITNRGREMGCLATRGGGSITHGGGLVENPTRASRATMASSLELDASQDLQGEASTHAGS
jgi:hypothetical protein